MRLLQSELQKEVVNIYNLATKGLMSGHMKEEIEG